MIQHITRFLANIFSPLLVPSYGVFLALWVSVICYQPLGTRLAVLLVVFGITFVIPMFLIGILHNFKIIKDRYLNDRKERIYPYISAIACYTAAAFYLNHVHAPLWLTAFAIGGTFTCVISSLINFKWKISAHSAGMAGLVALLFYIHFEGLEAFNTFWLLRITIILAGLVGTIRMYQKQHTLGQVIAGFITGFTCVYATIKLFA